MKTLPETMNVALKLAIVISGRTQRETAMAAGLGEIRLSQLVTGRKTATKAERQALAAVLGCPQRELFPSDEDAVPVPRRRRRLA